MLSGVRTRVVRNARQTRNPWTNTAGWWSIGGPGDRVVAFDIETCVRDVHSVLQQKFERENYARSNYRSGKAHYHYDASKVPSNGFVSTSLK